MLLPDVTLASVVAEFVEATLCTLVTCVISPIQGALPSLVTQLNWLSHNVYPLLFISISLALLMLTDATFDCFCASFYLL
jgi:hypothetical protein